MKIERPTATAPAGVSAGTTIIGHTYRTDAHTSRIFLVVMGSDGRKQLLDVAADQTYNVSYFDGTRLIEVKAKFVVEGDV